MGMGLNIVQDNGDKKVSIGESEKSKIGMRGVMSASEDKEMK